MTDAAETPPAASQPNAVAPPTRPKGFLAATELDTRMLGMVGALAVIWIGFHVLSGGNFLTPRNLWNLSVQSASVACMATGMVLVIVTRNIDLSVGSLLGFIGMVMGVTQAEFLPELLGRDSSLIWVVALLAGGLTGALVGALQGYVIAYLAVPAFIVTLGGLLIWRGAAWWVTSGRTVAPMNETFRLIGGGADGSIGSTWTWIVALVVCAIIVAGLLNARRSRARFGFPARPLWAEGFLALVGCGLVLGAAAVANSYYLPRRLAQRYAEANGIPIPEDAPLQIAYGFPVPVLIAVAVGVVMTFMATRTRFGRYVFATGGNPEAAALSGVDTKKVTMQIFILMGILAAIGSSITTARLNAATNAAGTLDELLVIAAAVIGGTSLAGGVGTIAGAMIGAVVMQSLQSGMILLGVDAPLQNIVVGAVLVVAVWIDTAYRRRTGA